MKIKTTMLPLFTMAFSVFGIIARFWMNTAGTDKEGFVISGHPSVAVSIIIFALTIITLGLCAYFMDKTPKPFSRSVAGAVGCFLGSAGLLVATLLEANTDGFLGITSCITGMITAIVFVVMGMRRLNCKPTNIWLYVLVTVYFVSHLLLQYQQWSQIPELSEYMFPVLGSIFLMLAFYHRASKDLGKPSEWQYMFFSQAALFCCIMASFIQNWLFYSSMAIWLLLDSLPGKEQK